MTRPVTCQSMNHVHQRLLSRKVNPPIKHQLFTKEREEKQHQQSTEMATQLTRAATLDADSFSSCLYCIFSQLLNITSFKVTYKVLGKPLGGHPPDPPKFHWMCARCVLQSWFISIPVNVFACTGCVGAAFLCRQTSDRLLFLPDAGGQHGNSAQSSSRRTGSQVPTKCHNG